MRLLNSTAAGEVLTPHKLTRHRNRAGMRIGDGPTIDLLRYAAWLAAERHARRPDPAGDADYELRKERSRAKQEEMARSGRDIAPIPAIVNPERREACRLNPRLYIETYHGKNFSLAWSEDHLRVIERIRLVIIVDGQFAIAMPRGSGKTSIFEALCCWAISYGHRVFVFIVAATEDLAVDILHSIMTEWETNDLLLEDFPEIAHPIRRLEGIRQRANGQLFENTATRIKWSDREVVFPTIPGSAASGAVIRVSGITGSIRGAKHKRADGTSIRPDVVLVDDPQTPESARSPSQTRERENIILGDLLGLAGPGKQISVFAAVTVIAQDDLADRLLNRDLRPEWQGERTKMVYAWPTNETHWREYARLWEEGQRTGVGIKLCTEYYRKHRAPMDAGARVAWPANFNRDELSAIQHAWNLRLKMKDPAFFAECQNEPIPDTPVDDDLLKADAIAAKLNGLARRQSPPTATMLTAFVDVMEAALYYAVVAWEPDFTGHVIDYGTEPDQGDTYFVHRDIKRRTLRAAAPGGGIEAAIYAGLDRLARRLLARQWSVLNAVPGTPGLKIELMLIDAGDNTSTVYRYCNQSEFASILLASRGKGITAAGRPMAEWPRHPGERRHAHWIVGPEPNSRQRRVLVDTNHWKSFVQARIATPMGGRGCLSLWGDTKKSADQWRHRCFAEHLTAETRVNVAEVRGGAAGRTTAVWRQIPGRDNHWLDCIVGCAVAASIRGTALFEDTKPARKSTGPIVMRW